ncbi:hypothetical protein Y032_0044g908 [Ancylostoma ceylanicum]|uniref:Uncharacterized protein n=1 Tax=Ancylostoma ceylanicum TaxID=53326 RepID=A0A016UEF4_9BILA|nr:hypothetical protein Y032_0044g908 [Ancylostoma ceylanicum]
MLLSPSEHIQWSSSERLLDSLNISHVENDDHTGKGVPSLTYAPTSDSWVSSTILDTLSTRSVCGKSSNNNVTVTFGDGDAQVHISLLAAVDGDKLHAVSVDAI